MSITWRTLQSCLGVLNTHNIVNKFIQVNGSKLFNLQSNILVFEQVKGNATQSELPVTRVYDRDPAPLFFNPYVQKLLQTLTGFDLDKIFHKRHIEFSEAEEEYKFMTEAELKEAMDASINEGRRLLQMPPIVQVHDPINEVLSYDPALEGAEENKILIADVSVGISDRERIIVARDPDGTLRQASWDERHRMNELYNPRPGRYLKMPELFEDEYLMDCLGREEYAFILDFACSHFEPDDPVYHKVTMQTFEHINQRSKHEVLESTRHYGPLCFYLAWHKKISNLLIQYLRNERLENCVLLIKLYHMLKCDGKEVVEVKEEDYIEYVEKYINEDESPNKPHLRLAFQTYQETLREKLSVHGTIESSHGFGQ